MASSRRYFLKTLGAAGAAASLPAHGNFFFPARPSGATEDLQARLAADPLRPQFHLLPARGWMNDPDGPIFWKNEYHMFFQYNPHAAVWGDMHWAHAVSPDMIHWKHLPIALAPTAGGYDQDGCFTGSAVDDHGTPTLIYTGVTSVPPAEATLRDALHNFREVQCLATSRDPRLRTWEKLREPILTAPHDPNLTGFRDPCLWRDGKFWYMGIGSGQRKIGGQVLLYRSEGLRRWEYLHPLASGKWNEKQTVNPVDSGEMWECPDFFPLGKKHVLFYSSEGKVIWETGELDPKELVFHSQKTGLLDYGAYYAPKSQLDAHGNRILWGWIPEARPEAEFSAAGWAGCMSLPRILRVEKNGDLGMYFLPQLEQLRAGSWFHMDKRHPLEPIDQEVRTLRAGVILEPSIELQLLAHPRRFRVDLADDEGTLISIGYDPEKTGAEWTLNGKNVPLRPWNDNIFIRLYWDGSVVEAIANLLRSCTVRVYRAPKGPVRAVFSDADLEALISLAATKILPISPDRLTA